MDPITTGAVVSGGASLLSGVADWLFGKKRDDRQFRHEKAMAEYAYSKDLEQWERANEYNAPTQQMARLREAGLNPAMIYGSGGAKTVAAQTPKYQAVRPRYSYGSPFAGAMEAINQYQNYRLMEAQIDNAKSVAKSNERKAHYDQWYYNSRADNELYKSLINLYQSQALGPKLADGTPMPTIRRIMKQRLENAMAQYRQTEARTDLLEEQKELTSLQADHYLSQLYGRLGIDAVRTLTGAVSNLSKIKIPFKLPALKGVSGQFYRNTRPFGY